MDPFREFGKWLIGAGLVLAALGVLLLLAGKLPLRLGRLPGDIAISGRRGTFYFPITTCILISLILTLALWLISALRK